MPVSVIEIVDCKYHISDGVKKGRIIMYDRFLYQMKNIDTNNKITYIIMFDGSLDVQMEVKLFKCNYKKLTVMCGVEHTVYKCFNDFSKHQF